MAPKRGDKMQNVRAVDRAIEILQCFTPEKPSMSVIDIQERVPLSRPTLYRLLQTLASKGLIRAFGDPQRFSLDYGVGRLAHNWMAGIDKINAGRPIVERLREITDETAALFILRGDQRLCVMEMAAPHFLKISRGVGETEHISSGASGKAILAFMSPDAIEPILQTLPKSVDRKRLLSSLDTVRSEGFAVSRGEVFVGAIAIAAPYFDHSHRVVGSIGVFGPQARLDDTWEKMAVRGVIDCSRELSAALGHFQGMQEAKGTSPGKLRRKKAPGRAA
jgi:DNA-binding IclR family transcriptional regulator